jgi:hypothetical protein
MVRGISTAETAIIDQANLPWKDSVRRDVNGNLDMEVYKPVYTGWDGISADIDQSTAEIVTNGFYIDMGLAGRTARKEICEYALKNRKTVVANSYPASAETTWRARLYFEGLPW